MFVNGFWFMLNRCVGVLLSTLSLTYARSCIFWLLFGVAQGSTAFRTPVLSLATSLQRFATRLIRHSDALSIKFRRRSVVFLRGGQTRLPISTSPSLHCTFRFLGPPPRTHHLLSNLRVNSTIPNWKPCCITSAPSGMERFQKFTWPEGIEESVLRQKKVTCTIPVHGEFRRITHRREGTTFVNSIYNETGCIVVAHWDQQTIKRFDVFAGAGSQNAVVAVNKWIARGGEKSKDSSAWAKTPAFNHDKWYQEQLERNEDERMEFFLGPVPDAQPGDPVRESVREYPCPRVVAANLALRLWSTGLETWPKMRLRRAQRLATSYRL